MRIAWIVVGVGIAHVVVAGCYQPTLRDCSVECSAPTDCSGDQVCRDGWCTGPSAAACEVPTTGTDSGTIDVPPDAMTAPDSAICALGCTNGTCDPNGVCVIDCSATGSCLNDVFCPANVPCRVVCGDSACQHHVTCGLATSCEIQCAGTNSCADEIRCGAGRCQVTCSGSGSCDRRTKCAGSCACDVSCTGTSSCGEVSECPMTTSCRLGLGCSSLLPGCATCT